MQNKTALATSNWLSVYQQKLMAEADASFAQVYRLPMGDLYLLRVQFDAPLPVEPDNEALELKLRFQRIFEAVNKLHSFKPILDRSFYKLIIIEDTLEGFSIGPPNLMPHGRLDYENEIKALITDCQDVQILHEKDWQLVLEALPTPGELWRFIAYRHQTIMSGRPLDTINERLTQFLSSLTLFEPAIAIDNTLIKAGLRDEPNNTLVQMALAQKSGSALATRYREHLNSASEIWSQLCVQNLDNESIRLTSESPSISQLTKVQEGATQWLGELLDESLFSRYELVSELYNYHQQPKEKKQNGYVVHQHSYESLGRHYVMVFYGTSEQGNHAKSYLQPRLERIADDVATRLTLKELHHIIVLGVAFEELKGEVFIELDTCIKPVRAMTNREKRLAKQLRLLQQQQAQFNPSKNMPRQFSRTNQSDDAYERDGQAESSTAHGTCIADVGISISIKQRAK